MPGQKDADAFGKALRKGVSKLKREYVSSETVVMEHAFVLISEGLLNIPDVGRVNVKQGRAFLWNAAWLQEYMALRWRGNGELQASCVAKKTITADDYRLAIIGPGGTGKTAVLKLTEALITFLLGADIV